jgi:tetratricopeptide (TPR) repeat protein
LALFHLGNALAQINDVGGAVEAYNKYIATYGTNTVMLGLVHQRLAYAHLLSGDREAAVKSFMNVLALPGALNKDQVLFELGRFEESRSRPEGAVAHYQDLLKIFPNSPFAGEATIRLKALEAKLSSASGTSSSPAGSPTPTPEPPKNQPGGETKK